MHLRNTWYAAVWSELVPRGGAILRRMLDEPIALFRDADGVLSAIADNCPHRFAPLSKGRVLPGGLLECPYHGLVFDKSGNCVHNPHGSGRIPPATRVKSYAVVEKHLMAWVWMGAAEPDPSSIPDYSVLDAAPPEAIAKRDYLLMDANYLLINENLLDLSHVSFLHNGILGNSETVAAQLHLEQKGRELFVGRFTPNVPVPGLFDLMYKRDGGRVDLWADMRWTAPACLLNDTGVTEPSDDRRAGVGIYGVHILTPETETTTHYHFTAARWNPRSWGEPVDTQVQAQLSELRRYAFEEQDQVIIAAQQRAIFDPAVDTRKPVLLEVDAGPVRFRRILDAMIAKEQAGLAGAQ